MAPPQSTTLSYDGLVPINSPLTGEGNGTAENPVTNPGKEIEGILAGTHPVPAVEEPLPAETIIVEGGSPPVPDLLPARYCYVNTDFSACV